MKLNKRQENQRAPSENSFFPKNHKVSSSRNSFFPKNHKGDIPIMVLVIGVFAICSLTLLSFQLSFDKTVERFVGIGLIENINVEIEQYSFSGRLDDLELRDIRGKWFFYQEQKVKGGFFELERTDEFPYVKRKERILFSVKYALP